MSKFDTQHMRVMGKNGFNMHRDGKITWKTSFSTTSADVTPYEVIEHETVAAAKAAMGALSSASH